MACQRDDGTRGADHSQGFIDGTVSKIARKRVEQFYTELQQYGIGPFTLVAFWRNANTTRIATARILDARAQKLDEVAQKLASHYSLDHRRVRAAIEPAAVDYFVDDKDQQLELVQKFGPMFRPSLRDLFAVFDPERALSVLESDQLPEIQDTVASIEYLNLPFIPFYTLEEFAGLATAFTSYLENNRDHLLKWGYPQTSFEQSKFFEQQLGRLYYVKLPVDIEKIKERWARAAEPAYSYHYTWGKADASKDANGAPEIRHCLYQHADLLEGLEQADADRLDDLREQVFDIKLNILGMLVKAVRQGEEQPSEKCLGYFTGAMASDDIEFCRRMDMFYVDYAYARQRGDVEAPYVPVVNPGGFGGLLTIIWLFESELTIGPFRRTRKALGDLVNMELGADCRISQQAYLEALGTRDGQTMTKALTRFKQLQDEEVQTAKEYDARVAETLGPRGLRVEPVLVIRDEGRSAVYFGKEMTLTPAEGKVLCALAERPGRWSSYYDLKQAGWSTIHIADSSVRAIISSLRSKFGDAGNAAREAGRQPPDEVIATMRGSEARPGAYRMLLSETDIGLCDLPD